LNCENKSLTNDIFLRESLSLKKLFAMRKKIFYPVAFLALSAALITGGCKNRENANKNIGAEEITPLENKQEIKKQVKEFLYPLPTTLEVVQMLQDIGISYIIGISNPTENVNKYMSSRSKAMALGVYGADLSYASVYNMQQDVISYLDVIRKLAGDLYLQDVYNEKIVERINNNLNNKDSLVNILTNVLFESYNKLNRNGKGDIALMMVTGGWVEALYLTTHVSANSYDNYELVKIIAGQKESLDKLMDVLNERKDDPAILDLIETLQPLQDLYNKAGDSMTEKQLHAISVETEKIRNKLLS